MSFNPPDYDPLAEICARWWSSLQPKDVDGTPLRPNRAALAELRRIGVISHQGLLAVDVGQALGISAFHDLFDEIRTFGAKTKNWHLRKWLAKDDPQVEPFAIAVATLARVRSDASGDKCGATARLLGRPRGDGANAEDRLFAEARFKRLIRTRNDWPGLMAQARRVAAILEREAPIGDLGASLILWNAEPRITRDWAFQYYQREFTSSEAEAAPADA